MKKGKEKNESKRSKVATVVDEHLSSIYKIRNNALIMLSNRNKQYAKQIKEYYADTTIEKFEKMYSKVPGTDELSIHVYLYIKELETGELKEQCIIYFLESFVKLDKATFMRVFKTIYQTFDKHAKVIRLIIVAPNTSGGAGGGKTKSNIEKHLATRRNEINAENKNQILVTEFFTHSSLSFDLISHKYVPKHILIKKGSPEEITILKDFQKEKLPEILRSDPVSKYYAAEVGDIFMIFRESPTTGFNVSYRVVVDV